jgi:hypothetical protein
VGRSFRIKSYLYGTSVPVWKIRAAVPRADVPVSEGWRAQYLNKVIWARMEMKTKVEDTADVDGLIDSRELDTYTIPRSYI